MEHAKQTIILQEIAVFIKRLHAEEEASGDDQNRTVLRGAIGCAENFAQELKRGDTLVNESYERLYRLVSDSVPWNEGLISSWNKIMRLWRKREV